MAPQTDEQQIRAGVRVADRLGRWLIVNGRVSDTPFFVHVPGSETAPMYVENPFDMPTSRALHLPKRYARVLAKFDDPNLSDADTARGTAVLHKVAETLLAKDRGIHPRSSPAGLGVLNYGAIGSQIGRDLPAFGAATGLPLRPLKPAPATMVVEALIRRTGLDADFVRDGRDREAVALAFVDDAVVRSGIDERIDDESLTALRRDAVAAFTRETDVHPMTPRLQVGRRARKALRAIDRSVGTAAEAATVQEGLSRGLAGAYRRYSDALYAAADVPAEADRSRLVDRATKNLVPMIEWHTHGQLDALRTADKHLHRELERDYRYALRRLDATISPAAGADWDGAYWGSIVDQRGRRELSAAEAHGRRETQITESGRLALTDVEALNLRYQPPEKLRERAARYADLAATLDATPAHTAMLTADPLRRLTVSRKAPVISDPAAITAAATVAIPATTHHTAVGRDRARTPGIGG